MVNKEFEKWYIKKNGIVASWSICSELERKKIRKLLTFKKDKEAFEAGQESMREELCT